MSAGKTYDFIFMGSGIGALTCASIVSRIYRKKVLILEQHETIGGFSGSLVSKSGSEFEIGIHQVGELHESTIFHKIMKFITLGKSRWKQLPENFLTFQFPDDTYKVFAGEDKQKTYLKERFPDEAINIDIYYRDIRAVTNWYRKYTMCCIDKNNKRLLEELFKAEESKLAVMSTREYLELRFGNSKLQSFLASHWTDYGLPPSQSAFLKQCLLVNNYRDGVYYPETGSRRFIESVKSGIEDAGGTILCNTQVLRVQAKKDTAHSVLVNHKDSGDTLEHFARYFVSGIGITNTYKKLLRPFVNDDLLKQIDKFNHSGASLVKVYATLKKNPETIGADSSLLWIYNSLCHEETYRNKGNIGNGYISQYSISFPSLKKEDGRNHTMKINTLVDFSLFNFELENEKAAISALENLKLKIGRLLLNDAEKYFPGLFELIETWEVLTPVDVRNNTLHYKGNIFGIPDTPERYLSDKINCFTPLANVFLTGSDVTSSGIYASVLSGVLTAQAVFQDKDIYFKIVKQAQHLETQKV
ncbi:NAD(P)/FAD-dependent oxidoreductase [Muricauda sp. MAR_2010_75]|uniref:phytoene desaturase family protein n=1 Tax=Allomuricauda sp. MAR_2010_75 TaxID=1250232 RepID=UPI0005691971|nr:NAD(P)-binding protein [Muricauda sp. MAR_2010_75]